MADTNFSAGTIIASTWLDDVNTNTYTILSSVAGTNTITGNAASTVTVGYPRGVAFRFLPVNTNTGPVTINISGLGAKAITKYGTNALVAGDLTVGSWAYIAYDGTQFQLINPVAPTTGDPSTYSQTLGLTTAYTLATTPFSLVTGSAVKLIFHATNTTTTPTLAVGPYTPVAMKVRDSAGNKIDPIVGLFAANTPATAVYDGVNWVVIVEYPAGRLLNVQVFSANGTYTPTPGMATCIIECVGGGGAGGGAPATGAGQVSCGAGGGGGSFYKARFTAAQVGASQAVTVGTAGAGVAGASGGSGTASSVGALINAPGGAGGQPSTVAATVIANGVGFGGAVGTTTGTPIMAFQGNPGTFGWSSSAQGGCSGNGAAGPWGGGGTGSASVAANGQAGVGAGAGGAGAILYNSQPVATTGGAGSGGRIMIYEYS